MFDRVKSPEQLCVAGSLQDISCFALLATPSPESNEAMGRVNLTCWYV